MNKREKITSMIREQIEHAQKSNDIAQENNLKVLLGNVHLFSENECKSFLLGMEFQKQLPTTHSFSTF